MRRQEVPRLADPCLEPPSPSSGDRWPALKRASQGGPVFAPPTPAAATLSYRRPRVRLGAGRAPGGGIHHCIWQEAGGASPGAPRRPALSARQDWRAVGAGALGGCERLAAGDAVSRAGAGAASPALIGPSPAAWAGNCCLGVGVGVGVRLVGNVLEEEGTQLPEWEPGSAQVGGGRDVHSLAARAWHSARSSSRRRWQAEVNRGEQEPTEVSRVLHQDPVISENHSRCGVAFSKDSGWPSRVGGGHTGVRAGS